MTDRGIEIGSVEAVFRYPVKSMRGYALDTEELGSHGIVGDRRLALRRLADGSAFPWLSASKLPELVLHTPVFAAGQRPDALPTHVRTPGGSEYPVFGDDLAAEIGRRCGTPLQMTHVEHGTFDDASVSVIASGTVRDISSRAGRAADVRRFRPNILVRLLRAAPFEEDRWVGGVLSFGPAASQ